MKSTENPDWKKKYAELLDEYEGKQSDKEQYTSLLQRALIRSTFLAQDMTPELDKALENLRNAVRKEQGSQHLEHTINELEQQLLQLEEQPPRHAINSGHADQQAQNRSVQHIQATLTRMLSQLPVPADSKSIASILEQRLEAVLDYSELSDVIPALFTSLDLK